MKKHAMKYLQLLQNNSHMSLDSFCHFLILSNNFHVIMYLSAGKKKNINALQTRKKIAM